MRKALIGHTGALGLGCRPGFQPQLPICLSTFGSWAMIEIGTSWLELWPLTIGSGWWSPSTTITSFLSSRCFTNEIRVLSEYTIDRPYAACTRGGLLQNAPVSWSIGIVVEDRAVADLVPRICSGMRFHGM